jgi:branched-chain amino acid transport system permease protein
MLSGFLLIAFAYGLRPWVVTHGGLAFTAVAFVIGGMFPLMFNQSPGFVVSGAQSAAIYILLALGLNVVVGFAGLLDLGYAAFFAIGAYSTASMASGKTGLHLPFWAILFLGAAIAALFGALLGAPTLRLRGDYLAIVTLGFGEIVPDMAQNNLFGATGGPNGISGIDSPQFPVHGGPLDFGIFGANPRPYFWTILIIIALVVVLLRNAERSRIGRAWVAIREDEVAASATGINTVSTKLLAFAIGASVSGFAGAFFGAMLSSVGPDNFQFAVSVTALTTVVLGGIGNITGVIVGAVLTSFVIFWVLGHMKEWMGTLGGNIGVPALGDINYNDYKFIVYGLILIGVMLLRPSGLLPSRARKVELETGAESEPLAAVQERG